MAFDFEELTSSQKVTAVYVAYYGRAADPAGRDFWSNQLDQSNGDLSAIIDAFGTSPEAVQRFGTLSNEAAVRTLYRDLFNREPEQAGLDFFVGELEAGRLSLQTIALDVLNGARNDDATIATNKIIAGETYTDALVATGSEATLEGTRVAVAAVDETDASLDAAQGAIDTVTGQKTGVTVQGNVLEDDVAISQLTSPAGPTDVGVSAAGFLGISDGANLIFESSGFDNLQAGSDVGGSGTVVVSGTGTAVVTSGTDNTTQIGRVGEGVLLVSDGARLETLQLEAGQQGRGEVLIAGQGTEVLVTPANGIFGGEFSNQGGFVRAGRDDGSYGRIVLSDGALLNVVETDATTGPGMNIAQNAGSRGEVVVDASTAQFIQQGAIGEFGPFINVGRGGEGVLDVRNGGAVTLSGESSSLLVGRGSDQGQGDGTLSITGGSRVESLFYNIAFEGGSGRILVSGENSTLAAIGAAGPSAPFDEEGQGAFVTVGRDGFGTLTVEDGGQVQISTETGFFSGMNLGRNPGSEGVLSVVGTGSEITISNTNPSRADSSLTVGRSGNGEANIESGGKLTGALFVTLGRDENANGALTVTGEGSLLEVKGAGGVESIDAGQGAFINVGRDGSGSLTIRDGGTVRITSETGDFTGLQAGRNAGSDGIIVVDGDNARLEILSAGDTASLDTGWAKIGRGGTGELQIINGAQLVHDELGVFVVGSGFGGQGTVTMTGSGSQLDAGSALLIGADVSIGAFSPNKVNFDPGASGNVNVGDGAELEAGGQPNDGVADIFIGANGTLEIESGGTLVGDVRVVGGSFDLADGAIHQGDLLT